MTPSEILTAASALLTKETWCQGVLACDAEGRGLYPNEPGAVRWCLLGACCKIVGVERPYQLSKDLLIYIQDGIWDSNPGWDGGGPDSFCHPSLSVQASAIGAWHDGELLENIREAVTWAIRHAERDESHD